MDIIVGLWSYIDVIISSRRLLHSLEIFIAFNIKLLDIDAATLKYLTSYLSQKNNFTNTTSEMQKFISIIYSKTKQTVVKHNKRMTAH